MGRGSLIVLMVSMVALLLLSTLASSRAETAPSTAAGCWKKVPVAAGTLVNLRLREDGAGELSRLSFHASEGVAVQPTSDDEALAGTVVELQEDKGRIVLDRGQVTATEGARTYLIGTGDEIELNAQRGTRFTLGSDLPTSSEGKFVLPAGSPQEIELDEGEALPAEVVSDSMLVLLQGNAWLRRGALPVVSGGRSVEANFHAPGATASELVDRAFHACVSYKDDGSKVIPTGVDVVSTRDGVATLAIWIPESLGRGFGWLWQPVELTVLESTTGLVAGPVTAYIGNPLISAVLALLLTGLLILGVSWLAGAGVQQPWSWLSSLIDEGGGRKSLALFQIAAWTLLVLAGMFYVLAMSGSLLDVSEEMLVLLGLAGVGAVAARWVDRAPAKPAGKGFASMFFVGEQPDLTRLQMFLFTLLIWVYVAWRIVTEQAFPTLGANVLLLMGISSGVYVAAKWAQTTTPSQDLLAGARRLRLTLDTLSEAVSTKQQEIARHQSTVNATQDSAGNPLPGREEENKNARDALTRAQAELTKLQADLTKAKTDWGNELEGLKSK